VTTLVEALATVVSVPMADDEEDEDEGETLRLGAEL
jgi:hypothetical protein